MGALLFYRWLSAGGCRAPAHSVCRSDFLLVPQPLPSIFLLIYKIRNLYFTMYRLFLLYDDIKDFPSLIQHRLQSSSCYVLKKPSINHWERSHWIELMSAIKRSCDKYFIQIYCFLLPSDQFKRFRSRFLVFFCFLYTDFLTSNVKYVCVQCKPAACVFMKRCDEY